MRRGLLALTLLLTITAIGVATARPKPCEPWPWCRRTPSPTPSPSPEPPFPILIGTYDNEQGGRPDEATSIQRAREFDYITAGPQQYRDHVAAMHAANPDLVMNVYINGTHTRNTSLPEEQYCHDSTGARITTTGTWAGNILMDPASTWRDTLLLTANNGLAISGYDGVFIDTLGRGSLLFNTTGRCVDARTGEPYTVADWEQATSQLALHVKAATDRYVVANGGSLRGVTYFATPSAGVIGTYADAMLSEAFTRNGGTYLGFYTEAQIVADIDMVADARFHVLVKDWRSVDFATKDQAMRYGFCAFLLATDGTDVFGYTGSAAQITAFNSLWDTDVGQPLGGYYSLGNGRYRRDFTNVSVTLDTINHTGQIQEGT
jgi:hypothetical protein